MNQFKMSLFLPPISPVKDSATGRTVHAFAGVVRFLIFPVRVAAVEIIDRLYIVHRPVDVFGSILSGVGEDKKTNHSGKGVDRSGKDLVRACFLSYDEEALIRREI